MQATRHACDSKRHDMQVTQSDTTRKWLKATRHASDSKRHDMQVTQSDTTCKWLKATRHASDTKRRDMQATQSDTTCKRHKATRHASDTKQHDIHKATRRDVAPRHCKAPQWSKAVVQWQWKAQGCATKGRLGTIYIYIYIYTHTHTYICMYTKGFFSSESRYGRNPSLDNREAPALVGSKIGEKSETLC